jgi:peptide deformylase
MGLFADKKKLETMIEAPDVIVTDIEFLRQKSALTDEKEILELDFVNRCKACLKTAWTAGFGLAAIQIGIPIQAAWYAMKINGATHERLLWNTKIITAKYPMPFKEGCLSIPDKYLMTTRFQHIKILNGDGHAYEMNGLEAVIVQHEIDHFNGALCIDREMKVVPEPGRNEPCPCGSGKKFKKCCFISGNWGRP